MNTTRATAPEPAHVNDRARNKLSGRHISIAVAVGLVVVALAIAAGWVIARPYGHDQWADVIRSAVLAVGAIAAAPAGYVAYRKQQTTEHERHDSVDKEQRRREELSFATDVNAAKDYRDRYASAAHQLGSDKAAIRLAGVYALAQLADEWGKSEPDQRQVCIDVLCAYLRMPTLDSVVFQEAAVRPPTVRRLAGHPARPPSPPSGASHQARQELLVRSTIIKVIVEHLKATRDEQVAWWANAFDLTGAHLPECDFSETRIDGALGFRGAHFAQGAWFNGAIIAGRVSFDDARFLSITAFIDTEFAAEATFHHAKFTLAVSFSRARFAQAVNFLDVDIDGVADFTETKFAGDAWFDGSIFANGALFPSAHFCSTARFETAVFGMCGFTRTTFHGPVSFAGAKILGTARFEGAVFGQSPDCKHATVMGSLARPDGTIDSDTQSPRSLGRALGPTDGRSR